MVSLVTLPSKTARDAYFFTQLFSHFSQNLCKRRRQSLALPLVVLLDCWSCTCVHTRYMFRVKSISLLFHYVFLCSPSIYPLLFCHVFLFFLQLIYPFSPSLYISLFFLQSIPQFSSLCISFVLLHSNLFSFFVSPSIYPFLLRHLFLCFNLIDSLSPGFLYVFPCFSYYIYDPPSSSIMYFLCFSFSISSHYPCFPLSIIFPSLGVRAFIIYSALTTWTLSPKHFLEFFRENG